MEKLTNMAVIDFSEYIKDLEICKKDLEQIKDLIKSFNENYSSYGELYIEFKTKESKLS